MKLSEIQSALNVPKNRLNKFGGYNYRSAEDIVEAVKKIINPAGLHLTITDEIVMVGNRVYVKATAMIGEWFATGFAREEETKKGMDAAQITGSASSYARKYALNGLLAIDDTKDADATNTHGVDEVAAKPEPKLPKITPDQFEKAKAYVKDAKTYAATVAKYELTAYQDEVLFNQSKK